MAALLVPFMSVLYIGGAILVILGRPDGVLPALSAIVRGAFEPQAALGGAAGFTLGRTFRIGVSRGVFTHEGRPRHLRHRPRSRRHELAGTPGHLRHL